MQGAALFPTQSQGEPGGARVHGIEDERQVSDQKKQVRILHQHQRMVLECEKVGIAIGSASSAPAVKLSRYRPDVRDVAYV